jgi:hypothetical protein
MKKGEKNQYKCVSGVAGPLGLVPKRVQVHTPKENWKIGFDVVNRAEEFRINVIGNILK